MKRKLIPLLSAIVLIMLIGAAITGCGNGNDKDEEVKGDVKVNNGEEILEKKLEKMRDVGNPEFINEAEFIVTAVPEENEYLTKDFTLYSIKLGDNQVESIEKLSLQIYSYLTSFLRVEGDYLFYPAEQGELSVLDRETLEELEVLGAQEGFHVSEGDQVVYKLPEGPLDTGDEFRIYDMETSEDFLLYRGDPEETLIFSYLKENEGIMYSKIGDDMSIKHLKWGQNQDQNQEITEEVIVELDYFAESLENGYVPSMDEEVIIIATEARGGTRVAIYNFEGEELYEETFAGFEGKLYLSPDGEHLGVIVSDKGDYYCYLIELAQKELKELPPSQDMSWCPSSEKIAYYTHLRDVGIYNLIEDSETMIFE